VSHRVHPIVVAETSPRREGIVASDSREKTRKVVISYTVKHPKYGKHLRRRTVLHAHDQENVSHVGDRVEIAECRPISKTKNWVVLRVLERAAGPAAAAADETGSPARSR
jgi:small subunit ribosomal protein S17